MTFWCLTAPHPAWVIRLWFLRVNVSGHLPTRLNSANRSPVYRLAVQNETTNSADTDLRFVAQASSDAYLWNCLLHKLGGRLWSVLFFLTSRSCVVFFNRQSLVLKYVATQRGLILVLGAVEKGTFNHGQCWKVVLKLEAKFAELCASKGHEIAEHEFIYIDGTISKDQCTALGGWEVLWFVRK